MNESLTLGAVPFLNAEPLIWPLENGVIEHPYNIVRALPSDLVGMLASQDVDCAIAPIVSLLEYPRLVPIPDVAIACRGPVASVLLFHNDPFDKLELIWLDPASRTSNLLVQILRDRASTDPCKFIMPSDGDAPSVVDLSALSGRLLIGDPALSLAHETSPPAEFSDLGDLWRKLTGHPFTFARWIARNGDIAAELKEITNEARSWSLLHLHELIEPLSEKYGFPPDLVDRYLRFNITYMYGPREQAGVREFFKYARKFPQVL